MGVWDAITEVLEAAMPWGEVEAEAPSEETQATQVGLLQNPLRCGDGANWSRAGLISPEYRRRGKWGRSARRSLDC